MRRLTLEEMNARLATGALTRPQERTESIGEGSDTGSPGAAPPEPANSLVETKDLDINEPIFSENNCQVITPGRNPGSKNIDPETKAKIGAVASLLLHGEKGKFGESMGLSPAQISNLQNGNNTDGSPNAKVKNALDQKRDEVTDGALNAVMKTLGLLNEEGKMAGVKPTDLSKIALNLASTVNRLTPDLQPKSENKVQIILHSPGQHKEEFYGEAIIAE